MTYRRKIYRATVCLSIILFAAISGPQTVQAQDEEDLLDFFPSVNPVLPPTSDEVKPVATTQPVATVQPAPVIRSTPAPVHTPTRTPLRDDPDSPNRSAGVLDGYNPPTAPVSTRPSTASLKSSLTQARQLSQAFRIAADKVKPTVVTIRMGDTSDSSDGSQYDQQWANNPSRAFNLRPDESVGSGFVVDTKGIILTNYHVLKDFPVVQVELPNGRQFEATQVRYDEDTDLAVVWIDTNDPLPAATLGDSDSMETGDWVLAIGSPFGLNQTVSAGIISGKSRSLHRHSGSRFLQTDAAINPGNSGGPLVNLDGQVIGINTAIVSQSGGYQGIGFTIPSNLANWVMRELINHGSVRRGYLGVAVTGINSNIASRFGVRPGSGVIITDVYADTPAAKAGMLVGDIITSFDGHEIRSQRDLRELIERTTGGDRRPITVIRGGKTEKIEVAFIQEGAAFNEHHLPPTVNTNADEHTSHDLGFSVTKLTPEVAKRLGMEKPTGVLINHIAEHGPAHREGIEAGYIILHVGRDEINSVQDFIKEMESEAPEKGVLFLIRTDVGNRYVVLKKIRE